MSLFNKGINPFKEFLPSPLMKGIEIKGEGLINNPSQFPFPFAIRL